MSDDTELAGRVAVLEESVTAHHSAQDVRDEWLKSELNEIKNLLNNGIISRVAKLEVSYALLEKSVGELVSRNQAINSDIRSVGLSLLTDAIKWAVTILIVLAAIHFLPGLVH